MPSSEHCAIQTQVYPTCRVSGRAPPAQMGNASCKICGLHMWRAVGAASCEEDELKAAAGAQLTETKKNLTTVHRPPLILLPPGSPNPAPMATSIGCNLKRSQNLFQCQCSVVNYRAKCT